MTDRIDTAHVGIVCGRMHVIKLDGQIVHSTTTACFGFLLTTMLVPISVVLWTTSFLRSLVISFRDHAAIDAVDVEVNS